MAQPLIRILVSLCSYRSATQWLNRGMKEDAPAFLTVTSLQLPDSPIPLIDSQAIARSCGSRDSPVGSDDKDAIMDELLRKVVAVRGQSEGHRSKRNKDTASKCTRDEFADLEECTQRIMEGSANLYPPIRSPSFDSITPRDFRAGLYQQATLQEADHREDRERDSAGLHLLRGVGEPPDKYSKENASPSLVEEPESRGDARHQHRHEVPRAAGVRRPGGIRSSEAAREDGSGSGSGSGRNDEAVLGSERRPRLHLELLEPPPDVAGRFRQADQEQ